MIFIDMAHQQLINYVNLLFCKMLGIYSNWSGSSHTHKKKQKKTKNKNTIIKVKHKYGNYLLTVLTNI